MQREVLFGPVWPIYRKWLRLKHVFTGHWYITVPVNPRYSGPAYTVCECGKRNYFNVGMIMEAFNSTTRKVSK